MSAIPNDVVQRWTVVIGYAGEQNPERVEVWSAASELDSSRVLGRCQADDHVVYIRTRPDETGNLLDERVVPWHHVLDYRQETFSAPLVLRGADG